MHDLRNSEVFEGKPAHFEGKLTPSGDPNLKIEWFFNGKPLQSGSRFRVLHDFGYVALVRRFELGFAAPYSYASPLGHPAHDPGRFWNLRLPSHQPNGHD